MVKTHKKTSTKSKKQSGSGVSNSCISKYASNDAKYSGLLNPQASLDNKTMLYGNPISLGASIVGGGNEQDLKTEFEKSRAQNYEINPAYKNLENNMTGGDDDSDSDDSDSDDSDSSDEDDEADDDESTDVELFGGANKCGDEGVGTNNFKSETFKEYLEKLNSNFNINTITKGGFNNMAKINRNNKKRISRKRVQKGSGYVVDPSQFVGGQPVFQQYDDCCPPAIVGGQMKFGAPDQAVCGFGAVRGGGNKKRTNKYKKSKKTKKCKNKFNKSKKSKMHRKSKRNSQYGGDFNSIGSKPADYSTAFNGQPSVFKYPDDMSGRTFDETQPVWSPNAI